MEKEDQRDRKMRKKVKEIEIKRIVSSWKLNTQAACCRNCYLKISEFVSAARHFRFEVIPSLSVFPVFVIRG